MIAEPDVTDELVLFTLEHIFPAAFALLPGRMDSPAARAMLLAIGLQESRFRHREQVGGPARGFWQFERGGGVTGVLTHDLTAPILRPILRVLRYDLPTPETCHDAIADNDILACIFARLLLWTNPAALPGPGEAAKGWSQYLATWRPGKPHANTWAPFFQEGWRLVEGT